MSNTVCVLFVNGKLKLISLGWTNVPTRGAPFGLTNNGPLCEPDRKSTVLKLPETFSIFICVPFVKFSNTVAVAFVLSCVIISPFTTEVGWLIVSVVTVLLSLLK